MKNTLEAELLDRLAHGWRLVRLAVEAPDRVPGWDWILVTAANDAQACMYERQLCAARRRGLIPDTTRAIAVPDPGGVRVGSGGATLNALRALVREGETVETLGQRKILLLHAGGDSKRLPWASVPGKLFMPFPLLATPDHSVPTLFDHLLAASAALITRPRSDAGLLFSLTGDVLPLFDSSRVPVDADAATVVTAFASLDVAGRHGVIVPESADVPEVSRLLQKPSVEQMTDSGALEKGGAARIDTGLYLYSGSAFAALLGAACDDSDPVARLEQTQTECSLYEELSWALVPAHHAELEGYEIGSILTRHLGGHRLRHWNAEPFEFVHLGSSAEYLSHLSRRWLGQLPSQVLVSAPQPATGGASGARCYAAELAAGTYAGNGSAVLNAALGPDVRVGNRCVVADVNCIDEPLRLPDNCCLWQVPVRLQDEALLVTLCCGVDDNPKETGEMATFCNRGLMHWMRRHGVGEDELWPTGTAQTLWNARLFPALPTDAGLTALRWTLARKPDGEAPPQWRRNPRFAMADLQRCLDVSALFERRDRLHTRLVLRTLRAAVSTTADRNLAALALQLPSEELRDRAAALIPDAPVVLDSGEVVPESRQWQMRADLAAGRADQSESSAYTQLAYASVPAEVAQSVSLVELAPVSGLPAGARETVSLPVRFDWAGGWSDTPPYCLERPAAVLNFALELDGVMPVRVEVEALETPEWRFALGADAAESVFANAPEKSAAPTLSDPFVLLKTALLLCGYGSPDGISQGVRIRSTADVPKGSGLGTSSILGAAVVCALQRLAGRPADSAKVSDLVLNLEQRMTTGGGWQDQIGGLVPGTKFITSAPARPLGVRIESVPLLPRTRDELEERFVIAFSGQERLAKNVLQIVVSKYLRRDRRMLEAVEGLVDLAHEGRRILSTGRLDALGPMLREVWSLHQQLDPYCSNPDVDAIFRRIESFADGYKLAGAGGGGFMGVLAKDVEAAECIRQTLREMGHGITVHNWRLA